MIIACLQKAYPAAEVQLLLVKLFPRPVVVSCAGHTTDTVDLIGHFQLISETAALLGGPARPANECHQPVDAFTTGGTLVKTA